MVNIILLFIKNLKFKIFKKKNLINILSFIIKNILNLFDILYLFIEPYKYKRNNNNLFKLSLLKLINNEFK